ncbi:hypothetical protein EMCRGX_G008548 [Ephydatia muelleri]
MPTSCACGAAFSVEHALSCPKGGFPSIRHNEIRDYTAYLLSEICHNVSTEPHFQPIRDDLNHLPVTAPHEASKKRAYERVGSSKLSMPPSPHSSSLPLEA